MELISQRVAAGLDVTPSRKHKRSDATESADVDSSHKKGSSSQGSSSSPIDWKKWGDRVAIGKSAVSDIKRLKPGNPVSPRLRGRFFYASCVLKCALLVGRSRSMASSTPSYCRGDRDRTAASSTRSTQLVQWYNLVAGVLRIIPSFRSISWPAWINPRSSDTDP